MGQMTVAVSANRILSMARSSVLRCRKSGGEGSFLAAPAPAAEANVPSAAAHAPRTARRPPTEAATGVLFAAAAFICQTRKCE